MARTINPLIEQQEPSGIRKIFSRTLQTPGAINLTIGQPDFDTPEHIKAAGIEAIKNNHTAYTPNPGLPELRKEVAAFFREKYNVHYNPSDEILITTGASEAIDVTFRTILAPGDEVILPAPIYVAYEPLIQLAGSVPVFVDTSKTGFKATVEALAAAVTDKTKAVLFNYPSNPTGVTYSPEEIAELAAWAETQDFFVITDEIYSENVFGGTHASMAAYGTMRDRTIVVHGLSKSHSMTGWRVGFLLAPAWLTLEFQKVHMFNVVCATTISQYAAIEALRHGRNDSHMMNAAYIERRDYVYDRLVNMGLEVIKPNGAFYIFPKIPQGFASSEQFAFEMLDEAGVAVVPGSAFTKYGEGYIRISYAYSMDVLKQGLDRMAKFVNLKSKQLV